MRTLCSELKLWFSSTRKEKEKIYDLVIVLCVIVMLVIIITTLPQPLGFLQKHKINKNNVRASVRVSLHVCETQSAVGFRHHVTNHLSKHAGNARPTKPDPAKNRARQSHLSSCKFADAEGCETGGKSHDQQVEALWLPWRVHWSASSHPWSGSHTCNQTQRRPEKSRQIVGPWQETGKSTPNHPKLRDFLSC